MNGDITSHIYAMFYISSHQYFFAIYPKLNNSTIVLYINNGTCLVYIYLDRYLYIHEKEASVYREMEKIKTLD